MAAPKKGAAPVAKKPAYSVKGIYKVEGEKLTRAKKSCPKCGDGVFLGGHKDRSACGKCGYTEFSKQ